MLMLFLSFSGEVGPPRPAAPGDVAAATTSVEALKPGVTEQIIYDLSLANEKLERDVQQLRQYVLDVRRTARSCGCDLDSDDVLTLFPELHNLLVNQTATGEGSSARAAVETSDSSSTSGGSDKEAMFMHAGATATAATQGGGKGRRTRRGGGDGDGAQVDSGTATTTLLRGAASELP